jgi:hypothetical protein
MLSRGGWIVPGLLGAGLVVAPVPAQAQSNIDAGKSPAQIFSDTCNACHRSPRELKPTNQGFLREHYTTGVREAAAMAAYVASVGSDPQAVRQRRPPAMGAGQAPAAAPAGQAPAAAAGQAPAADNGARPPQSIPSNEQAKPGETQAALPASPSRRMQPGDQAKSPQGQASAAALRGRRPSDSLEAVTPFATLATGATPATDAPASPAPVPEPFEE